MKWRSAAAIVSPILSAIACAVLIGIGAYRQYEEMVGDVVDGKKTTFCDLPTPVDDTRGLFAIITFVLVSAIFLVGLINTVRGRRVTLSLGLGLALYVYWAYEFFLRTMGC